MSWVGRHQEGQPGGTGLSRGEEWLKQHGQIVLSVGNYLEGWSLGFASLFLGDTRNLTGIIINGDSIVRAIDNVQSRGPSRENHGVVLQTAHTMEYGIQRRITLSCATGAHRILMTTNGRISFLS